MKVIISLGQPQTALAKVQSEHTDEFISSLLVMLLYMNEEPVIQYGTDFANWNKGALAFSKEFGISRDYTKAVNLYLNKKLDEESFQQLGADVRAVIKKMEADNTISRQQFSLLKNVTSNIKRPSVSTWNAIHRDVDFLNNAKLSASFTVEEDGVEGGAVLKKNKHEGANLDQCKATCEKLMKLIGASGVWANEDQEKEMRERFPDKYSEYAKARAPLKELWTRTLFNLIRASGEPLMLIDEVKKHMDKKGISNNIVEGLIGGYIDAKGKCYTAEKKQLNAVPYGKVRMNPDYDPKTDSKFVCKALTEMRKEFRTLEMVANNKKKTFSAVKEFLEKEDEFRAKWIKDLMAKTTKRAERRKQIIATMIELIYQTKSRIGGKDNKTKGEPTYGMSTLQIGHLKLTPSEISYNYTGKKGAAQEAKVKTTNATNKQILKILTEITKGRADSELVFMVDSKPVIAGAVNDYMKEIGLPAKFTVHRFRNAAGTKAAMEIMKSSPFKKNDPAMTQAKVEKWFETEAVKIGEMLMHRNGEKFVGSTSIASYIDPEIVTEWFTDKLGLRKPKFFDKK